MTGSRPLGSDWRRRQEAAAGAAAASAGVEGAVPQRAEPRAVGAQICFCVLERAGRRMRLWPPPLLLLCCWGLPPVVGHRYPHSAVLDGASRYRLSWGPQGSAIAFRLEVRTQGYVGFGFSPTGAMASADIVVGGVDRGKPYLQVRAERPRGTSASLGRPGREWGFWAFGEGLARSFSRSTPKVRSECLGEVNLDAPKRGFITGLLTCRRVP